MCYCSCSAFLRGKGKSQPLLTPPPPSLLSCRPALKLFFLFLVLFSFTHILTHPHTLHTAFCPHMDFVYILAADSSDTWLHGWRICYTVGLLSCWPAAQTKCTEKKDDLAAKCTTHFDTSAFCCQHQKREAALHAFFSWDYILMLHDIN